MTGKQEEPGFDPAEIFNEGVKYQAEQNDTLLREQIAEQLVSQGGFNPDEVEQLLFSEGTDVYAPRRGRGRKGKRACSAKQWAKMPQICRGTGGSKVRTARRPVRVYDPPSRGGYVAAARSYYKKRGGAKGMLGKFKKYAAVGGAGLTFIGGYTKRAKELKAEGAKDSSGKVVDGILEAIQYDLANFDSAEAMDRLKKNMGEIATPLIAGWAVKETKILGKYSGLAGDLLMGMGGGIAAKTILDPPITAAPAPAPAPAPARPPVPTQMTYGGNPTGGF